MSQLELPPISFARYFDLLKRRRWQVIPMSLTGLLVGGVVAFLIPRYYVADTSVTYLGGTIDTQDVRDSNDPMQLEMINAPTTVENLWVPEALEKLGVLGDDVEPGIRQSLVDGYRSRTEVKVYTPREGNRLGHTQVTIQYKDTEGQHSADFANALREAWIRGMHGEALESANEELAKANDRVVAAQTAVEQQIRSQRAHLEEHGIGFFDEEGKIAEQRRLDERVDFLQGAIEQAETTIAANQAKIDELQEQIGALPAEVERQLTIESDPATASEVAKLMQSLDYWRRAAQIGGPSQAVAQRRYAQAEADLRRLNPGLDPSGQKAELVPNPKILERKEQIDGYRKAVAEATATRDRHQQALDEIEVQKGRLPAAWSGYLERETAREVATQQLLRAREARDELNKKFEQIRFGRLFREIRAVVPAAPTDPNIVLVALIGAGLGLGVAIGLVLLLDMMRSNFKTIHDVEYALSVPVLGMMSHLETDSERVETVRHRRRIAIAAASFLLVSFSVVAVYYLDPTRLPLVVYDALHMILGPAQ